MILEIIATITSRFQSSLRQGIKLNPLYTLSTMTSIFYDKFDKVSCAMTAKKPANKVLPIRVFGLLIFVVHRYPYRGSKYSPRKLPSFHSPHHLRHYFCQERCLRLSNRILIMMTLIKVYIINPVDTGFQMHICSIIWFWVHLRMSSSKTHMLLLEKNVFHEYWPFCNRFIVFAFVASWLLPVICKQ